MLLPHPSIPSNVMNIPFISFNGDVLHGRDHLVDLLGDPCVVAPDIINGLNLLDNRLLLALLICETLTLLALDLALSRNRTSLELLPASSALFTLRSALAAFGLFLGALYALFSALALLTVLITLTGLTLTLSAVSAAVIAVSSDLASAEKLRV